jgi:hypothetical protein
MYVHLCKVPTLIKRHVHTLKTGMKNRYAGAKFCRLDPLHIDCITVVQATLFGNITLS